MDTKAEVRNVVQAVTPNPVAVGPGSAGTPQPVSILPGPTQDLASSMDMTHVRDAIFSEMMKVPGGRTVLENLLAKLPPEVPVLTRQNGYETERKHHYTNPALTSAERVLRARSPLADAAPKFKDSVRYQLRNLIKKRLHAELAQSNLESGNSVWVTERIREIEFAIRKDVKSVLWSVMMDAISSEVSAWTVTRPHVAQGLQDVMSRRPELPPDRGSHLRLTQRQCKH